MGIEDREEAIRMLTMGNPDSDTSLLLDEIDRLRALVSMGNQHLAATFAPLHAWGGVFDVPEMLATCQRAVRGGCAHVDGVYWDEGATQAYCRTCDAPAPRRDRVEP